MAHTVIEPLLFDAGAEPTSRQPLRLANLLQDVRQSLTAIEPSIALGPIHWFQYVDPDIEAVAMGGIFGSHLEIMPISLPATRPLDLAAAQMFVPRYLALARKDRDRVAVALQRLEQAMLRRSIGDKAADLSIALETLLVDDRGEHRWKVSTRAALLTGWDTPSKLHRRGVIAKAYDLRSSLMHSGFANAASAEVVDEAIRICGGVIRAIVERGRIPSWAEFDVTGGS